MSNIKVFEINGKKPGATLSILGGVHGNEFCGVEAIKSLAPFFKIKKGKIFFIIANKKAIQNDARYCESDLNRAFNSKLLDTIEKKTAKEIKKYLDKSDAMFDIHASTSRKSKPFIICEKHSLETAKYLPASTVLTNLDEFHSGSTDEYMNKQRKIGICFECGYLKDKKTIEVAKNAIRAFCASFGLTDLSMKKKQQETLKAEFLYRNKNEFELIKEFDDFEEISKNTVIGHDGLKKISSNKDRVILFASSREKPGMECFLIAKKLL